VSAVATGDQAAAAPDALRASGLTVRFGGISALTGVNLWVAPRTIVGLVGPNGAGKSTAFAVLSGLLKPNAGTVELGGVDVSRASPQARARLGLARTFQQPEMFMGLTVREHLLLADRVRFSHARLWKDVFTAGALRPESPVESSRIDAWLEMLGITAIGARRVGSLPLGTTRLVEVGRALAKEPTVLLLDEPFSGLNTHEADSLMLALGRTALEHGLAMLLVEHDVPRVLSTAARIFVLDFGEIIAEGTPDAIRADPAVRTAYLGDDPVDASRAPAARGEQ
jgi:ABC-type branched-subunit amino acid transport system ATPase component